MSIRTYDGKSYDMSKLPNGWYDYCSTNPGIERANGLCIVWSNGDFKAGGNDFEQNLARVLEGRLVLRSIEVKEPTP
jgi:hypothetical protein